MEVTLLKVVGTQITLGLEYPSGALIGSSLSWRV